MSATVNIEATGVGKTIKDISSVEKALQGMVNKVKLPDISPISAASKYFKHSLGDAEAFAKELGIVKNKMDAVAASAMLAEDSARFVGGIDKKGNGRSGRNGRTPPPSTDRRGFALLAASQAFEDFSFAGMKGVLNNIPQMMMFAGASATMTAAVSLLAVSLSIAGPHLFTVSKALDAAAASAKRAEAFAAALKEVNDAMFDFDLSKWSEDQIKGAEQSMDSLTKSIMRPREALEDFGKGLDSFASKNEILRGMAEKTKELFAPKAGAATRGALFDKGSMQNELTVAQKKLKETQDAIGRLESRIPFISNANIGKMSDKEYRGKFQEAKTASAFAKTNLDDANKSADELKKKLGGGVNSTMSFLVEMAKGTGLGGDQKSSYQNQNDAIKAEMKKVELAKSASEEAEKNLKLLEAQKAVQDKYGDNYEKVLEAARKERDALGDANKAAREAVAFEEQKLAAQEKYIAGLQVFAAEENLRKVMDYNFERMPSASAFLSDKGRIGLGGDQYKSAMGAINYQRQANSLLTQIARNTLNLAKGNMNAVWAK